MGNKVVIHQVIETDSTNRLAKELARDGADHLTLVLAHQQTSGRGRYGREWISSAGNVFWSMIVRPGSDWPSLTGMSHVAALAVHATIVAYVGDGAHVQVKWPNDVLVNGKKIAGILLEASPVMANMDDIDTDRSKNKWVVVGIGINVTDYPSQINYPATSLYSEGAVDCDREQVIAKLTHHFAGQLTEYVEKGLPFLSNLVLPLLAGIGERINVSVSNSVDDNIVGVLTGLDEAGRLIVTKQNGEQRVISSGDVFWDLKER
ncbi:MAG: biotin--[acetyl-CoA-carboxylase] ligase [Nitrosomonas sp.]|nr:biotin--[acetyl-CoA-carboxylase] ligase [Nitrosomonas sp.]